MSLYWRIILKGKVGAIINRHVCRPIIIHPLSKPNSSQTLLPLVAKKSACTRKKEKKKGVG